MAYVAGANCTECGQGRPATTLDENGVCALCQLTFIRSEPNPMLAAYANAGLSKGDIVSVTADDGEVLTGEITAVEEADDGSTTLTVVLF